MNGQEAKKARAHILFYTNFTIPSRLIEQALKDRGFHITAVETLEALIVEWQLGIHDLMLLDHTLPLNDKLSLLKTSLERHRPIPMIMVFEPDTEHEADLAKESGATACVLRDNYGEYLLKIAALVEILAGKSELGATKELPSDPCDLLGENTERIDLNSLAEEVRGMTVETKTASLVVLGGPDVGKTFQLGSVLCVLGRDATCQLCLHDESISRFHASLKQFPSGVVAIKDLDSTNGTYVEGIRVTTSKLENGNKILLGQNTVIKFQVQDAIDTNYYDELYYSATRDGLTGLYNRRCCLERISDHMAYAKRHQCSVSVLMLDIDNFKRINDTYGHQTGDLVLAAIANVIGSRTRAEDVLGRYGGEEFLLFALDTNLNSALILAERIRSNIEKEIITTRDVNQSTVSVTVSIGISTTVPGDVYDFEALIRAADANLYLAKANNRNCVFGPNGKGNAVIIGRLKR